MFSDCLSVHRAGTPSSGLRPLPILWSHVLSGGVTPVSGPMSLPTFLASGSRSFLGGGGTTWTCPKSCPRSCTGEGVIQDRTGWGNTLPPQAQVTLRAVRLLRFPTAGLSCLQNISGRPEQKKVHKSFFNFFWNFSTHARSTWVRFNEIQ